MWTESQLQQQNPAHLSEPEYLGVTLDRSLTYRQHLEVTSQEADITRRTLEADCWLSKQLCEQPP